MKKYREDKFQEIKESIHKMYQDEIRSQKDEILSLLEQRRVLRGANESFKKQLLLYERANQIIESFDDYHVEFWRAEVKPSCKDKSAKICIPAYFYVICESEEQARRKLKEMNKKVEEIIKNDLLPKMKGDEHGQA